MKNTLSYYNINAKKISDNYNSIDFSNIINTILELFKDSKNILEIGSGSGRDLNTLLSHGFNAIGIDGSEEMITYAVDNYPHLKNRLYHSILPNISFEFKNKFDALFSIATLMHLTLEELEIFFVNISKFLESNAKIFISVSGKRNEAANSDRFFLEMPKEKWIKFFEKHNLILNQVIENKDITNRNIEWYSFILTNGN